MAPPLSPMTPFSTETEAILLQEPLTAVEPGSVGTVATIVAAIASSSAKTFATSASTAA